jgi:hypothetical protein
MPFNPGAWLQTSSVKYRHRGRELQAVDVALAAYRLVAIRPRLEALVRAIIAWQDSTPNWGASVRAPAMVELINWVKTAANENSIFSYVQCAPLVPRLQNGPFEALKHRPIYPEGTTTNKVFDFKLMWDHTNTTFHNSQLAGAPPYIAGVGYYKLATFGYGPTVRAVSIKMHRDIRPGVDASAILKLLHPLDGASFMTTGQLSGCSFLIQNKDGQIACTHIEPTHFGGGRALQKYLDALALPNVTIYGRNDHPDPNIRVTIFGRRRNGIWDIFAQRYNHTTKVVEGVDAILWMTGRA